jgi:hypothetical protein
VEGPRFLSACLRAARLTPMARARKDMPARPCRMSRAAIPISTARRPSLTRSCPRSAPPWPRSRPVLSLLPADLSFSARPMGHGREILGTATTNVGHHHALLDLLAAPQRHLRAGMSLIRREERHPLPFPSLLSPLTTMLPLPEVLMAQSSRRTVVAPLLLRASAAGAATPRSWSPSTARWRRLSTRSMKSSRPRSQAKRDRRWCRWGSSRHRGRNRFRRGRRSRTWSTRS